MNNKIIIKGKTVDEHMRCSHYHSPLDIIAIRMKCCNEYYACIHCHEEEANHKAQVWHKEEFNAKAILCGNCLNELTITQYFESNYQCSFCKAVFNPRCSNHNHFYFEV